eukprot:sb/3475810/
MLVDVTINLYAPTRSKTRLSSFSSAHDGESGEEEEYPLSKTMEMGRSMEASQIPGETADTWHGARGFAVLDSKYFIPFFRKKFTKQEIKEAYSKMQDLTNQWHSDVEGGKISDGLDIDEHSL